MEDDRGEENFGELENSLTEEELKLILRGRLLKTLPINPEEHFEALLNPGYEPEQAYR